MPHGDDRDDTDGATGEQQDDLDQYIMERDEREPRFAELVTAAEVEQEQRAHEKTWRRDRARFRKRSSPQSTS